MKENHELNRFNYIKNIVNNIILNTIPVNSSFNIKEESSNLKQDYKKINKNNK